MSATTIALACRFLAIGGRFMIDPDGKPLFAIGAEAIFGGTLSQLERTRAMRAARSAQRLTLDRTADLATLIRDRGETLPGGWIVWEGR